MNLWDGEPPVPVELVLEHSLDLHISWETIEEEPGETIFACLRPQTRQVVVNEKHRSLFEANPGLERFSIAHEGGHADVFALADRAEEPELFDKVNHRPQMRSATHGPVITLLAKFRELSTELRTAVMREMVDQERARYAAGEDSPVVRRAVDHYAAVLLMPADLLREAANGRDLGTWSAIKDLARLFTVTTTAMGIRLKELGFIFSIADNGTIVLVNPAHNGQHTLL